MRGSIHNLQTVWDKSTSWERADGHVYYDIQRQKLKDIGDVVGAPLNAVVAAFAALSPNTAESQNYRALENCLGVVYGDLSPLTPIVGYPKNVEKAYRILRGADPEWVLGGLKVTAFYRCTLNPDDERNICIDGHMLGAWIGQRLVLRRNAQIKGKREYEAICTDMRALAADVEISAPRLQATLWLAWKRIHRILYSGQMKFNW